MAWTGATIVAKFRELTGRSSTEDISAVDALAAINHYYQENFPFEANVHVFLDDYTNEIVATDSGEYSLADSVLDLNPPWTANNFDLRYYHNSVEFFTVYPVNQSEHFITSPTLAVGTTSTKVLCAAFKYVLAGTTYAKASAETALSGDTVPQNKYGAWLLSVDDEGTITITEADDNATGYATAALAVQAITLPGADQAIMGFVTAINTGGTFVPGTTELDAETVTDTYTDGNPQLRNIPAAACIAKGKLFIRPKPYDTFLVRAVASLETPTALTTSSSPTDAAWGPAIATGAAIRYLSEKGDTEKAAAINGKAEITGTHQYNLKIINRKRILQDADRQAERSF